MHALTFPHSIFVGHTSAATVDVVWQELVTVFGMPYVQELPQFFFDVMADDVDGPLANDYRSYIRREVKKHLDRITDVMHAHFAAIEIPPVSWLMETFPKVGPTKFSTWYVGHKHK
eukprot:SAG31_NODE_19439_length_602_cov_0.765408_1_plen_116_part_00